VQASWLLVEAGKMPALRFYYDFMPSARYANTNDLGLLSILRRFWIFVGWVEALRSLSVPLRHNPTNHRKCWVEWSYPTYVFLDFWAKPPQYWDCHSNKNYNSKIIVSLARSPPYLNSKSRLGRDY
jgi:hypothetical protein